VKNNIGHMTLPTSSTSDYSFHKIYHHSITHYPINFIENTSNFLLKFKDILNFVLVNSWFNVSLWEKNHTALSRNIEVGRFGHATRLVCPGTSHAAVFVSLEVWQVETKHFLCSFGQYIYFLCFFKRNKFNLYQI
jgi:hypothetical protein